MEEGDEGKEKKGGGKRFMTGDAGSEGEGGGEKGWFESREGKGRWEKGKGVGDGSRLVSQAGKASLGESSSIQVREARKVSV